MEYRQFGRTGMKVFAVGFGCWEISGTYGPIDAAQFEEAVHRALDAGIDCFDTAEAYGMGISERALARALGARSAPPQHHGAAGVPSFDGREIWRNEP